MPGFRLTKAASRDLLGIGRYTRERWGEEQCRRYLASLDGRFHALARHPRSGRACDKLRPGYWFFPEGKHVIFYRMGEEGVEVIRILHERMLPTLHL